MNLLWGNITLLYLIFELIPPVCPGMGWSRDPQILGKIEYFNVNSEHNSCVNSYRISNVIVIRVHLDMAKFVRYSEKVLQFW